jgi:Tol biopolymer transport system component
MIDIGTNHTLFLPIVKYSISQSINKIVYASGYDDPDSITNIYMINPDGSGKTRLTYSSSVLFSKPRWSPDTSKIVMEGFTPIQKNYLEQIWTMNSDGSGLRAITSEKSTGHTPFWSPDGRKIVFSGVIDPNLQTSSDLYTINSDGSGSSTNITNTSNIQEQDPAWSPDGKRIAFVSCPLDAFGCQISVISTTGDNREDLTALGMEFNPIWSPDGKKIAFIRQMGSILFEPLYEIFTMNADGTNQKQLTFFSNQSCVAPSWSPDGSQIVFDAYPPSGHSDLYIINADGSGLMDITNTQDVFSSFAPDWH